jgi:hypothetical protein
VALFVSLIIPVVALLATLLTHALINGSLPTVANTFTALALFKLILPVSPQCAQCMDSLSVWVLSLSIKLTYQKYIRWLKPIISVGSYPPGLQRALRFGRHCCDRAHFDGATAALSTG